MFRLSGAIARSFRSRWFSGDVNLVIDKGVPGHLASPAARDAIPAARPARHQIRPGPEYGCDQRNHRPGKAQTDNYIKAPASVLPLETNALLLKDQSGAIPSPVLI